mgnify:FL=1
MKRINLLKFVFYSSLLLATVGCTNLDEEVLDGTVFNPDLVGDLDVDATLKAVYENLRGFQSQDLQFALGEISSDALVGPTRGGDWDDNGQWRQLHNHTWAPDHVLIRNTWNNLLSPIYNCNRIIEGASGQPVVEARFLRAFYYFHVIDLFGKAPYRLPGSRIEDDPLVWTRAEATAFVISELEEILPSLPARVAGDPSIANVDAAHFLLAKLYLNKAVYTAENAAGPYTFDASDMTKVVSHVDAISGTLESNYWLNFEPNNNTSNEILFSSKNTLGNAGNIQSRWRQGQHYNQTPSGWNGFATVADYYSTFQPTDARKSYSTPQIISSFGNPVGFQEGQMYAPGGVTPLNDRNGNPLVFTSSVTMITSGSTLETAGVRAMKYVPDVNNIDAPDNDYVLMRYSDALLMKAEAILRGGSGSVGTILQDIAARAGVAEAPNTLDGIYAERGRELWLEGWRRNDMVRFGTYLNQRELKPYASDPKYILFPIPAGALFNSNLTQNPGY